MKLYEITNATANVFHVLKKGHTEVEVWVREASNSKWQGYVRAAIVPYKTSQGTVEQLEVIEVYVDPSKRKQGLGTLLYNKVEELMQKRIHPSGELSDDAVSFWMKRDPKLDPDQLDDRRYGSFDDYDANYKIPKPLLP